jgi:hypothetical protein
MNEVRMGDEIDTFEDELSDEALDRARGKLGACSSNCTFDVGPDGRV